MAQQPLTQNVQRDRVIVIVADLPYSLSLVTIILQRTSYEALFARERFQAVELMKFITPHLFILDYQLPGMNGVEVYDLLHAMEELATIPAIILSNSNPQQGQEIAKRRLACVIKPVKPDEFISCIQQQLTYPV